MFFPNIKKKPNIFMFPNTLPHNSRLQWQFSADQQTPQNTQLETQDSSSAYAISPHLLQNSHFAKKIVLLENINRLVPEKSLSTKIYILEHTRLGEEEEKRKKKGTDKTHS